MAETAVSNAGASEAKRGVIESFLDGCKKGVHITLNNIMPSMILGYVVVQFLTLTGLIDLLSFVFGPIMALFGLPGEAVSVFVAAIFAKASGAAAAASLFYAGTISAAQATLLIVPCMLMGTLIGHYARCVLVSGVDGLWRGLLLVMPLIDTIIGLIIMRIALMAMGLW